MTKCLVVSEEYNKYYDIKNPVILMPSVSYLPPWAIQFREAHEFTKQNTILTDKLTNYFVSQKIFGDLKYSDKAVYQAIRPAVAFINYALTDRLLRIIRLLELSTDEVILPEVNFNPAKTKLNEFCAFARDSWEFNQYIVNSLMDGCLNVSNYKRVYAGRVEDYKYYNQNFGFETSIKTVKNPFIKRLYNAVTKPKETAVYLEDNMRRRWPVRNPVLTHELVYNEKEFLDAGFFAPFGNFKSIKHFVIPVSDGSTDKTKRSELGFLTQNTLTEYYKEFMGHFTDVGKTDEKIFGNISKLFFNIVPVSFLEHLETNCDFVYDKFCKFNGKHYFSGIFSGDEGAFCGFAAVEKGLTVWGIQHSAWGGYLADGAIIAEDVIGGCDYYITSGWSNEEPHLPTWRKGVVPMSSPHYSSLKFKKGSFKNPSNKPVKKILLCLGEIYMFQLVYDSFLKPDTLLYWSKVIEDIIQNMAKNKITVVLKMYSPLVARRIATAVEAWKKAGGEFLIISENYEKGSAQKLFDEVDAVIWDIPSGGFIECYALNKPAFVLWDEKLIASQPAAKQIIGELIRIGVFCENGEKIAKSCTAMYNSPQIYYNSEQKKTIDSFMEQFVKTNEKWPKEWANFIKTRMLQNLG